MAFAVDAYHPVQYEQGLAIWTEANEKWAQWRTAVTEAAALLRVRGVNAHVLS